FFASILSKVEDNIFLRRTNKAAANYLSKRPDAIIIAGEDLCLGFGECELENALKKDIVKLAMFTQRTINISNIQNAFSFNIKEMKVTFFFVTSLKEVVPSCIDNLPVLINMENRQ
ncbi:hypothetical protein EDC94DRAFT_688114, partial [Helicostylum pulchrum]